VARLEFFFDCSSPWTYLAFHRIEGVCAEANAELVYRPILVGGVFNAVNQSVYQQRANPDPMKLRHYAKDLKDWAHFEGIRIGSPTVFPVNSVKAMRGCKYAEESGCLTAYARAVFEAYWGELRDISQDDVLRDVVASVGLDPTPYFEHIAKPETKAWLRGNTEELIERGGFGSPTMFVNGDDMYFGNDRLPLVGHALAGHHPATKP
jgi:2-hydroxychromene-2-carboxylate isomerase